MTLDELNLPPGPLATRIRNMMWNKDIETIEGLCKLTKRDLLKTRNFGRKTLRLLEKMLASRGMKLKPEAHERAESDVRCLLDVVRRLSDALEHCQLAYVGAMAVALGRAPTDPAPKAEELAEARALLARLEAP